MIHVYKTYVTRRIHADELVSQELNPNPMVFAASKADEDSMYLHQARKEKDWKKFGFAQVCHMWAEVMATERPPSFRVNDQ